MAAFLPITEFQFVFCGFATFAATVGYACAKRRASTSQDVAPVIEDKLSSQASDSSGYSTSDEKASSDTEPLSRKRKSVDDHDASTRPARKRSRSPSVEADTAKTATTAETPEPFPPVSPNGVETTTVDDAYITMKEETNTPAVIDRPTESIQSAKEADDPVEVPAAPVTPPPSPPPKRATGFAAFAGTGSPFVVSPFSPNGAAASTVQQTPAWCGNGNVFGDRSSPALPVSQALNAAAATSSSVDGTPPIENGTEPNASEAAPLAAMETRKATVTQLTGEEDETVKSELKGVKLFIKRGTKGFTGGMPGHIKLLSRPGSDEERLLFRREPLWKVSMNVRVRPTVRCTFDEEDNVLRIVLKEAVEHGDGAHGAQELVIYALKRGRVPKKDFKEFVEALLENPLFKAPTPNEPAVIEP